MKRLIPHPSSLIPSWKDPADSCPQVSSVERLGEVVVHARLQAPLAVLIPRARGQGDDGQVASRRSLALPDCPDDLEAVQLRHVNVEEQQVEIRRQRSEVRDRSEHAVVFTDF